MESAIVRVSTAAWSRNEKEMEYAIKDAVMLHMDAISSQGQAIDDLTEDNDVLVTSNKALESRNNELESRNSELESRNNELESRNRELETLMKKMGKTLTKLRMELQTLKKQSAPEPAAPVDLWPTNLKDFYMALSIAPEQSEMLNQLLETVKEGMEAKDNLEEKMCAWHVDRGIDYVASPRWPINLTTYLCVLPSCPAISHLYKRAQDGFLAKVKLNNIVKDIIKQEFSL